MPTPFHAAVGKGSAHIFEKALDVEFTWKGDSYHCSINHSQVGNEVDPMGGFLGEASATINTLDSYFTEETGKPVVGSELTVDGVEWIVEKEPVSQAGTPLLVIPVRRPDGAKPSVSLDY